MQNLTTFILVNVMIICAVLVAATLEEDDAKCRRLFAIATGVGAVLAVGLLGFLAWHLFYTFHQVVGIPSTAK